MHQYLDGDLFPEDEKVLTVSIDINNEEVISFIICINFISRMWRI